MKFFEVVKKYAEKAKFSNVKAQLNGKAQQAPVQPVPKLKKEADRFYEVRGEIKSIPATITSTSLTYFTESGNVYVLTAKPNGAVVWEDLRTGEKATREYYDKQIWGSTTYDKNGKPATRLENVDGSCSTAIKGFFDGDIREYSSVSSDLMAKILKSVNPSLIAQVVEHNDPSDNSIKINQHPDELIVPACFRLKGGNNSYVIGNKHHTKSGLYVDYGLVGFTPSPLPSSNF